LIDLEGLSFRYRSCTLPALQNIDLRIADGEIFLIIGESGSGKTTLAKIMAGFLGPGSGEMEGKVLIDGVDVHAVPRQNLVGLVGLVQQDPESQMVTLNVKDELAFGLENMGVGRREMEERISWALESTGSIGLSERQISSLSGGELQKVAISSILALRPKVLILDEPTSSLDPRSAWEIGDVLGRLNSQGVTIVVIEHRYSWIAARASRMAVLSHGSVSALHSCPLIEKTQARRAARRQPPKTLSPDPLLLIEHVSFAYDGTEVLKDVTLDIRRGEMVGLMGDNGSGKTTLLLMIMGMLRPSRGQVKFAGRRVEVTSAIAREVGMVFQNPNHQIFESSINDEILFGPRNFGIPREEADARLSDVAATLGLRDRGESSPHALSLGEKRRLNVASVVVYEPHLYLLDEPFVGQDQGNVDRIMAIVREKVDRGASCLLVTHDPDLASESCDRIAFLKRGRVLVQGPPDHVFSTLDKEDEKWYLPEGWRGS